MRALRIAVYNSPEFSPENRPLLIAMPESSVRTSLEAAKASHEEINEPGVFRLVDIIEDAPGEDNGSSAATIALSVWLATEHLARVHTDELHMAMLYYWMLSTARTARAQQTGRPIWIQTTEPAPLGSEAITRTLNMLAAVPELKNGVIVCYDREGNEIALRDGKVAPTGGRVNAPRMSRPDFN